MNPDPGARGSADPAPPPNLHKPIAVRSNRRRCLWVTAVGLPLCFLFILVDPESPDDVLAEWLLLVASLTAFIPGVPGTVLLLSSHRYLVFDPVSRRLTAGPGNWRQRSIHPRRGFDRIEYSVYDARIYQIRTDGSRRRIAIPRWYLDKQDWRAFVDALTEPRPTSVSDNESP
ncbi:hypothetical protein [Glycomyces sp. YM15]|uniref:hypothetical protein n=1 Tax=Glycomyces sp. YM15 TaxID=2800446 RepID=UPI001965BC7B|nr:hypothetical protein [Glycomyces sp. YM15]